MAYTSVWLADVSAAGGDKEPPPSPNVPAEYRQKPRRQPAPSTYLSVLPPSTNTSIAQPKQQHAALSNIAIPNQKRPKALDTPASSMSQDLSPTRKSSRRTRATDKTPAVDNVIANVDLNTTPRPARRRRAAPLAPPIPDLRARPIPILASSASGEHDAQFESTDQPTTSRRTRSPTRRMVDLQTAKKPVVKKAAGSPADVPQNVRTLYKAIQALARRSKSVIPLGIENEVKRDADNDFDDLDDFVAKVSNGKTHEQLTDEFKAIRDIRNKTKTCRTEQLHEPSWNELVHSRMLEQAVLGYPGFSYYNITSARILKELIPGNESGELLKGKMVDYVVTLGHSLIPMDDIVQRLDTCPGRLCRTVNPSDYSPLCYKPVVLTIETKSSEGGSENGEVQLSVWAIAHFNRLRHLIQDPVTMTLPLVLVTGSRWTLYFASDLAHEIHLIDAVDIGTTTDIIGCYTILEALRVMFKWMEETFAPWFSEGVKAE